MKNRFQLAAFGLAFAIVNLHTATAFGQGSLTPSGAPAPTMKSLAQIEPRTPISSLPYTITNPGSYYLTGVLTGVSGTNGITVLANDVTVDLNGFALAGVSGSIDGIAAGSPAFSCTNLTVINGAIHGWGGHGIGTIYCENVNFERLLLNTNGSDGCYAGAFGIVRDCVAQGNGGYGFYGGASLFEMCNAEGNNGDGFHAGGCRVINCTAQSNSGAGIWAYGGSFVNGCLCEGNVQSGIGLGANSVALENDCVNNNTSGSSSHAGIYEFLGPGRIEGNHISYLIGVGIRVDSGQTKVVVIKNTTAGTLANSFSIPAGNDVGPWGQAATATSPWANIQN